MSATKAQQINLLNQFAINKQQIIDNTFYNQDDDNIEAYASALKVTAVNVLKITEKQLNKVLLEMHFTCDVGDYSTPDNDVYFILHKANINRLIEQVEFTYS